MRRLSFILLALSALGFAQSQGSGTIPTHVICDSGCSGGAVSTSTAVNDGSATSQKLAVDGTGKIGINNFPSSQAVTGTFWQSTQPISIATMPSTPVTGTFWQATQPVSLTQLPAALDGSGFLKTHEQGTANVSVQNSSLAVTGTFWQATQPISIASMPSTPVTGTFWQATQPVSWSAQSVTATQATGSNLHVVVDTAPTTAVTGTFWQATQPVSGTFWQSTQPVSIAGTVATSNTQLPAALDGSGFLKVHEQGTATVTGTVAISAGSAVIGHVIADTGSTTVVTGNVTVVQGTGTNLHTVLDSGTTTVTQGTGSNLHVQVDTAPTTAITAAALPLPSNAAQETGGNLATIATQDTSIATNTTGAAKDATLTGGTAKTQLVDVAGDIANVSNGSIDVNVKTIMMAPVLSQQQQANPLLYRAAMSNYCKQNLCPGVR